MSNEPTDFYEDDEPAEKVRAAFERGEKGRTAKRPRDVNQLAASIVAEATEPGPLGVELRIPDDLSSFVIEGVRVEAEGRQFRVTLPTPA